MVMMFFMLILMVMMLFMLILMVMMLFMLILMVFFVSVMVLYFVYPCCRGGHPIEIEGTGMQETVQVHIAIVALYDFCFGL